jgi:hypothetical protein
VRTKPVGLHGWIKEILRQAVSEVVGIVGRDEFSSGAKNME